MASSDINDLASLARPRSSTRQPPRKPADQLTSPSRANRRNYGRRDASHCIVCAGTPTVAVFRGYGYCREHAECLRRPLEADAAIRALTGAYTDYQDARRVAQADAHKLKRPMGIEKCVEYGRTVYRVKMLPRNPRQRVGWELRCEVVATLREVA